MHKHVHIHIHIHIHIDADTDIDMDRYRYRGPALPIGHKSAGCHLCSATLVLDSSVQSLVALESGFRMSLPFCTLTLNDH